MITTGKSTPIMVVYDQATKQWREMTDQEYEKERRAWSEDMKDMEQINRVVFRSIRTQEPYKTDVL